MLISFCIHNHVQLRVYIIYNYVINCYVCVSVYKCIAGIVEVRPWTKERTFQILERPTKTLSLAINIFSPNLLKVYFTERERERMKIVPFFRSLSRSVHEEHNDHDHDQQESKTGIDISGPSGACTSISLTVWRKSLVISCKGFTVIDSNGDLVYRVDNYVGHPREVTLMDGSGKSILTMRRNKVNLVHITK